MLNFDLLLVRQIKLWKVISKIKVKIFCPEFMPKKKKKKPRTEDYDDHP